MNRIDAEFSFFKAGQGAFYGGCIFNYNERQTHEDCWRIVYDCGTSTWVKGNSQSLNKEITAFKSCRYPFNCCYPLPCCHDDKPKIDILFISHLDYDHVSGVQRLLTEFNVKRVVIPHIPKNIRQYTLLSLFENDNTEDDDLTQDEYSSFIDNPYKFVSDSSEKTEIYVVKNEEESENKYGRYDPEKEDIYPIGTTEIVDETTERIDKLNDINNLQSYENNLQFFARNIWEFTTYVKPITCTQFSQLENDLKKLLQLTSQQEITFDDIKGLLILNRKKAHASYKKHLSDINAHGLVLLHGPINTICGDLHVNYENKYLNHFDYELDVNVRTARQSTKMTAIPRLSTLLLGDSSLIGSNKLKFPPSFSNKLSSLAVFQVPHHGASKNWGKNEYDNIINKSNDNQKGNNRIINVCNFGYGNTYGHPCHAIIDDLHPNLFFNTQFSRITTRHHIRSILREDWIEIEINEIANLYQPKTISSKMLIADGKYPVYGANGIIGNYDHYNHENEEFLITCRGATCGNVHITQPFSWINGNAMVVQPYNKSLLSLEYLRFVFSNKGRVQKAISGSAQPQITRTTLSPIKIPLSPLPEQRAIVSKIEELFSDLDKGIADLKKAQDQLKVYRQAVLKKAFEGGYTQRNIKAGTYTINGIKSSIPKSWSVCALGDLVKLQGGFAFKSAEYQESGIPIVKIKNVHYQDIDWSEKTFIDKDRKEEFKNYSLNEGDVLIAMTRPVIKSLNNVKTVVVKKTDLPAFLNQRVGRFLINGELNKDFLKYFIFTDFFKRRVLKESSSSQQPNISSTKIEKFDFIVPDTLEEQHQIVQEIESRLSVCDKVEESITESLEKAEALGQSILKKAFEGTLLSEEEIAACKTAPDYEPASVLLEKIKAQKKKKS